MEQDNHHEFAMNMKLRVAVVSIALSTVSAAALGQTPSMPDRPGEKATPVAPERMCERLAGAERERCMREARGLPDSTAQGPDARGSCDAIVGPEKELCLKRGGTVETKLPR